MPSLMGFVDECDQDPGRRMGLGQGFASAEAAADEARSRSCERYWFELAGGRAAVAGRLACRSAKVAWSDLAPGADDGIVVGTGVMQPGEGDDGLSSMLRTLLRRLARAGEPASVLLEALWTRVEAGGGRPAALALASMSTTEPFGIAAACAGTAEALVMGPAGAPVPLTKPLGAHPSSPLPEASVALGRSNLAPCQRLVVVAAESAEALERSALVHQLRIVSTCDVARAAHHLVGWLGGDEAMAVAIGEVGNAASW